MPTAPERVESGVEFIVTHPFHPLAGRTFHMVSHDFGWGKDRVVFYLRKNHLRTIPLSYTSLGPKDPFVEMARGKSPLHVRDLLELSTLVRSLLHDAKTSRRRLLRKDNSVQQGRRTMSEPPCKPSRNTVYTDGDTHGRVGRHTRE